MSQSVAQFKVFFFLTYYSNIKSLPLPLFHHSSPVESSRFGSSGNLSQTSSQLSETGQESAPGSGLEESLHSYHSTGFHPSINVQQPTNGHIPSNVLGKKLGRPCLDVGKSLNGSLKKLDHSVEKRSNKHLQRWVIYKRKKELWILNLHWIVQVHSWWFSHLISQSTHLSLHDNESPFPFSPYRIHWLKAINKVRDQLQEVGFFPMLILCPLSSHILPSNHLAHSTHSQPHVYYPAPHLYFFPICLVELHLW